MKATKTSQQESAKLQELHNTMTNSSSKVRGLSELQASHQKKSYFTGWAAKVK